MLLQEIVVLGVLISSAASIDLDFPAGFKFGVASSAYQVEGAWDVADKAESIWDHFTKTYPDRIVGRTNGDVACDSYHQWRRDVEMLVELGVDFYRFSISWARLLPTGFPNYVSDDGVKYYDSLINALLENDIEPVVTLYHWDMPQRLQDLGGWTNPHISKWFEQYAKIAFELYGDRVKTWITINEPIVICDMAYNTGVLAPGVIDSEVAPYLCSKHTLMAHAKAWRLYDKEFRHKYHGKIAMANQLLWFEPFEESDKELTELVLENCVGRYSHPIYSKQGGWPPSLEEALSRSSRKQGYSKSNLPAFTQHEIELIRGTYDFYALNYYTSRQVRKAEPDEELGPWPITDVPDMNAKLTSSSNWPKTSTKWFFVTPPGLRKLSKWLTTQYGNLSIFITENGYPSQAGVEDYGRIKFYRDSLMEVLKTIKLDHINIIGYTAWTLMDNFEWMDGYTSTFGFYDVDFTSENRTRTPKLSAEYYRRVLEARSLNITFAMEDNQSSRSSTKNPLLSSYIIVIVFCIHLFTLIFNSIIIR